MYKSIPYVSYNSWETLSSSLAPNRSLQYIPTMILDGGLHLFGTLYEVFNIRGKGLQ